MTADREADRYVDNVTSGPPGLFDPCAARYENYAETGISCELRPGHQGEHLAWMPVTWHDDHTPAAIGCDIAGAQPVTIQVECGCDDQDCHACFPVEF